MESTATTIFGDATDPLGLTPLYTLSALDLTLLMFGAVLLMATCWCLRLLRMA